MRKNETIGATNEPKHGNRVEINAAPKAPYFEFNTSFVHIYLKPELATVTAPAMCFISDTYVYLPGLLFCPSILNDYMRPLVYQYHSNNQRDTN
jgi:hypothetical protein